jgi:hypothetical protein
VSAAATSSAGCLVASRSAASRRAIWAPVIVEHPQPQRGRRVAARAPVATRTGGQPRAHSLAIGQLLAHVQR